MFHQKKLNDLPLDPKIECDAELNEKIHSPIAENFPYVQVASVSIEVLDENQIQVVNEGFLDYAKIKQLQLPKNVTSEKSNESIQPSKEMTDSSAFPKNPPVQAMPFFKWRKKKVNKKPSETPANSQTLQKVDNIQIKTISAYPKPEDSVPQDQVIEEDIQTPQKPLHERQIELIEGIIRGLIPPLSSLLHTELIKEISELVERESSKSAKLLGKIIFLIDTRQEQFLNQINTYQVNDFFLWVNQTFTSEMDHVKKRISLLCKSHELTGLQSSKEFLQTRLPYEIAEILITKEGQINDGLCDSVVHYLLPEPKKYYPFQQDIHRVLSLIKNSPVIREKLSVIKKPSSQYSLANHLIKIQTGKKYDESISDRDAKITALTACMSHLRQGPVGTCFATHLAIVLLSSHIEQCLDDFYCLIKDSKLTRTVGEVRKDFPFLLRMGSSSSSKEFNITDDARIVTGKAEGHYLWQSPGLIAACESIKIDIPSETLQEIVLQLFQQKNNSSSTVTTNIQSILSALCDLQLNRFNLQPSKKMKMYALAHFAFESQTRNGLLSVWENSLAEMAEGKEGSMIKPPIFHALTAPIVKLINTELTEVNLSKAVKDQITLILSHHLRNRIHLHYDPNIFNDSIHSQHMSSEGGYIIYDRKGQNTPSSWQRVDSPQLFSAFAADVFEQVKAEIVSYLSEKFPDSLKKSQLDGVAKKIDTEEYAHQAMITYYPDYEHTKNLIANWNKCKYTPWRTLSGNLADTVREVYMQNERKIKKNILKPSNAYDLLNSLLTIVKELSNEDFTVYSENPNKKTPVFTPTHAFSLTLGHPSLQKFHNSKLSNCTWIEEEVYTPAQKVIDTPVDQLVRDSLIEYISNELVSSDKQKEFQDAIELLPKDLPYPKLRASIGKLLDIIDNDNPIKEERIYLIDQRIFSTLPKTAKETLAGTAIHFADTNWYEGLHDIHLCITLNPCTGKLAIMQIYDNGKCITPVKQYWLLNHHWKFISNLKDGLPQNDT